MNLRPSWSIERVAGLHRETLSRGEKKEKMEYVIMTNDTSRGLKERSKIHSHLEEVKVFNK